MSVYGTDIGKLALEVFLGTPFSILSLHYTGIVVTTRLMLNGFAYPAPLRAQRIIPGSSYDLSMRHPIETY